MLKYKKKTDYTSGAMASEDAIMTAAEYSDAVYQWLQQAYQWQALAVGKITVSLTKICRTNHS